MSESFDLLEPINVVAGTIGDPGQRIFFIQAHDATTLVTLKLEKAQIQAVASAMAEVLDQLGDESTPKRPTEMIEPVIAAWTIAGLGIAIDAEHQRMVIIAEELTDDFDDEQPDSDAAQAQFHLSYAAARGFVAHALALIDFGRDFGRQNGHRPH